MKPVKFHPYARREASQAYNWYSDRDEMAAERFADELDRAVETVSMSPRRFPEYLLGTQRLLLNNFPYAIVYREFHDHVRVIAVPHERRRPGYWKARRG